MTTTVTTESATALLDERLSTWSEPEAERRLERVAACWESDGSPVDAPLDGQGHDGISALMGAMQDHYPDHVIVRRSDVEVHHDTFRVAWELRSATGDVALSGIDVGLISNEGRLSRINGYFGEVANKEEN